MNDLKFGGLRAYNFSDGLVKSQIDYIRKLDVINDHLPNESIDEITVLIEEIFAHRVCDELFDEYCNAKDKNNFVDANFKKAFKELGDYFYKDLMLVCNLNRSIDNNSPVILSIETFKRKADVSSIIKIAHDIFEKKTCLYRYQLERNKIARGEGRTHNQEYIDLENSTLTYLKESFPVEVNRLDEIDNIEEIKSYYKNLFHVVKRKIDLLNNRYSNYEPSKYPLEDKYSLTLRLKVIDRLKELEKFDPYKEIICNLLDIKPGYHHYASVELKDFADEWDIYYKKRPSVDIAINKIVNKKLLNGEQITAVEYFFLFKRNNLTEFGHEHLYDVIDEMSALIKEREDNMGISLIKRYSDVYGANSKYLAETFERPLEYKNKNIKYWNFHQMKLLQKEMNNIVRESENLVRVKMNLPKVNEGWMGESKLYQEIKDHFTNRKIIQHARLKFLGKQHLDILIPSLKVAIEYQGLQHDEPVYFFGGLEAYLKNKERDELKLRLCQENNIKLIYVREGYNLSEIIKEIIDSR